MIGRVDCEGSMKVARRWFTEGWAGNVALADGILSESVRTNGVTIGVAGPKRGIQERPAAFPDLAVDIEDMFSARDKVVTGLSGGTHTAHIRASGPPASKSGFGALPSGVAKTGKVVEISTIQDQFALIKQVGNLPGEVYAASPRPAGPGSPGVARLLVPAREGLPGPARACPGKVRGPGSAVPAAA